MPHDQLPPGDFPVREAIRRAQVMFHQTGSAGSPPFWDAFLHFQEEFEELLVTACRLRTLESMDLCETLEDLLGQVHERWEDVQKLRFCQALLACPPVRRRNQGSDLCRIDAGFIVELLGRIEPTVLRCAMRGPVKIPPTWRSFLQILPQGVATPAEGLVWEDQEEEGRVRTARELVLLEVAKGLLNLERPLYFPESWVGNSCMDLRLEAGVGGC